MKRKAKCGKCDDGVLLYFQMRTPMGSMQNPNLYVVLELKSVRCRKLMQGLRYEIYEVYILYGDIF